VLCWLQEHRQQRAALLLQAMAALVVLHSLLARAKLHSLHCWLQARLQ
jgi:hypothetical protein